MAKYGKWSRHFQCRAAHLAPQGRGVTRKKFPRPGFPAPDSPPRIPRPGFPAPDSPPRIPRPGFPAPDSRPGFPRPRSPSPCSPVPGPKSPCLSPGKAPGKAAPSPEQAVVQPSGVWPQGFLPKDVPQNSSAHAGAVCREVVRPSIRAMRAKEWREKQEAKKRRQIKEAGIFNAGAARLAPQGRGVTRKRAPGSGLRAPGSGLRAPGSGLRAPGSGLRAPGSGLRAPGSGLRAPAPGSGLRAPGSGLRAPGSGLRAPGSGLRAPGSGLRAPGSGLRAPGSGLRAPGSGLRAPGSGLRAPGSGLRAPGSGLRAPGSGLRLRLPGPRPPGHPAGISPGFPAKASRQIFLHGSPRKLPTYSEAVCRGTARSGIVSGASSGAGGTT